MEVFKHKRHDIMIVIKNMFNIILHVFVVDTYYNTNGWVYEEHITNATIYFTFVL